jgi:hypothetical protein
MQRVIDENRRKDEEEEVDGGVSKGEGDRVERAGEMKAPAPLRAADPEKDEGLEVEENPVKHATRKDNVAGKPPSPPSEID